MPKELVEYIAQNLVNDPSQVQLREKRTHSSVILELKVAKSDMGRVIGKQGRVANAIRSLLRVIETKDDIRIRLEID
ncbi:MAG: RNA-binding protein [Phototrophicales bacterium]|jgi:predicted RNA-binding protein YlqC (UPF0109 family)|nr:MAG: RNA-binding protein [Phototrophicales bacterium]